MVYNIDVILLRMQHALALKVVIRSMLNRGRRLLSVVDALKQSLAMEGHGLAQRAETQLAHSELLVDRPLSPVSILETQADTLTTISMDGEMIAAVDLAAHTSQLIADISEEEGGRWKVDGGG